MKYRENLEIDGICDDVEALKQTIFLILNTERYEHLIYILEIMELN
ncbi:DUF2634 domain-containing protein [Clostridioides difficile]